MRRQHTHNGFLPAAAAAALLFASSTLAQNEPVTPCAALTAPSVPGATVVSIEGVERRNFSMPSGFGGGGGRGGASNSSSASAGRQGGGRKKVLDFCDVNVTLTHGGAGDRVRVGIWLPLSGWNGRFVGTGGGGFIAGTFGTAMAPQVADGAVAGSTDAGLQPPSFDGSAIQFDDQLFLNFAKLSVHEMAVVGKAVAENYYGRAPSFAYWNGCSTGGRQGYMAAQAFPDDFDGIMAASPAINWDKFLPASFWPFVVQTQEGEFVPQCVMRGLVRATVEACDDLDGARDGLISDGGACRFDARSAVGKSVPCNNNNKKANNGSMIAITDKHATIYNRILSGPVTPDGTQLWFGSSPGTDPSTLAAQTPFSLSDTWLQKFVAGGRGRGNVTVTAVGAQSFADVFAQSVQQFQGSIGTANPDLTGFQRAGGKLLSWHGLSDQLIYPQGTVDYWQRVVAATAGGQEAVDGFYRLFTAPGVMHCAGGNGPEPTSPMDELVKWVEQGVAPDTLPAAKKTGNGTVTRNLCRAPLSLRYIGTGSIDAAESWTCARGSEANSTRTLGGAAVVPVTGKGSSTKGSTGAAVIVALGVVLLCF